MENLNNNLPDFIEKARVTTPEPTIQPFNIFTARNLNQNLPDYINKARYVGNEEEVKIAKTQSPVSVNNIQVEEKKAKEYEDLNYDAVDLLKADKQSWQTIKENKDINEAAIRFAQNHLGRESIDPADALELALEHFNKFDVNEMIAAGDLSYVSGLVTDINEAEQAGRTDDYNNKIQQLNDYRLLFTAKNSLPFFFQEGGRPASTVIGDVLQGLVSAPSTYLGLLLPVAGKAGAVGASQVAKQGVTKLLAEIAKRPIRTTMVLEGTAGAFQDVAAQKVEITTALKDEYSLARTSAVTTISGLAPAALVPLTMKKGAVYLSERNTGDLVTLSQKAIQKRIEKADKAGKKTVSASDENKKLAKSIGKKLKVLDPEAVARGQVEFQAIATKEGVDEPLKLGVSAEQYNSITGALIEITKKAGKGPANERITETIARAISKIKEGKSATKADKAVDDFFQPLMKKYNLTHGNIADMFMADLSEAGRKLSVTGKIKKELEASLTDAAQYDYFGFAKRRQEALKNLKDGKKLDRDYFTNTYTAKTGRIIRELDATRLAFMTSQPATTVRNVVGGFVRLPMDAVVRTMDTSLQKITGVERLTPNSDAWALMGGLLNSAETKAVEQIFRAGFSTEADKLLRPLIDVADSTKSPTKLTGLSMASRAVNVVNTISDNYFKRVALTGNLKRELNNMATTLAKVDPKLYKAQFKRNFNVDDFKLENVIKTGRFNDVFGKTKEGRDALQRAVEEALYFTYQKSPDSQVAKGFINGVHSLPFIATSVAPFPRFMVNAMRFTYEHSPVFLMLDKNAKAQMASLMGSKAAKEVIDGYTELSKGLVGSSMLMGATAFRMSEFAGDNWYEGKTSDGRTYDLRPFFPLAPYLFFADLVARHMKGDPLTPDRTSTLIKDTLQTVTGMQAFKTGFGLYAFESAIADIEEGNFRGMGVLLTNMVANIAETYTIPLTVPQDTWNTFFGEDDVRILKTLESPNLFSLFVNKSTKRIPWNNYIHDYMDEHFENYEKPIELTSPFTQEKIRRPAPLSRQLTGLMFRERKTLVEKEFIRLKMSRNRLAKYTKDPKVNNILNFLASEYAVGPLHTLITSDAYLNAEAGGGLSKTQIQRKMIDMEIKNFQDSKERYMRNLERGQKSVKIISAWKFLQASETDQQIAKNTYNSKYGEPLDENYDYEVLYEILKIVRRAEGFVK
jgi:hypothetical protein